MIARPSPRDPLLVLRLVCTRTQGYVTNKRFRLEFDYHSLGLVLLEIGLWDTIARMNKSFKAASPQELREKLIAKRIPLLGHCVGRTYRDAVLACLHKGCRKSGDQASDSEMILEFERIVLKALRQLVA